MKIVAREKIKKEIKKGLSKNKWYIVIINDGEIKFKLFDNHIQIIKTLSYQDGGYYFKTQKEMLEKIEEVITDNIEKSNIIALEMKLV